MIKVCHWLVFLLPPITSLPMLHWEWSNQTGCYLYCLRFPDFFILCAFLLIDVCDKPPRFVKNSTWQAHLTINQRKRCLHSASVNELVLFLLISVRQVLLTHLRHCFSFQERMVCVCVFVCVAVCTRGQLYLSSQPWSLVTPCCETDCLRCGNRSSKRRKGLEDGVSEMGEERLRCTQSSCYPRVSDMSCLGGLYVICSETVDVAVEFFPVSLKAVGISVTSCFHEKRQACCHLRLKPTKILRFKWINSIHDNVLFSPIYSGENGT